MATAHLRSRVRWSLAVLVVAMLALSLGTRSARRAEPATASELMRVATQFNHDYQVNDAAPVWERFDEASRAVITRTRYLQWHRECPASPGAATTIAATTTGAGWWIVTYEIGGVRLHDYWHQENGRWRFSLVRSNPSAVTLYESSFATFARATGCVVG